MTWHEQAETLMRKAAEDEFVLDKLVSDPLSPDAMIGFHAQQAVEKRLKAVLNWRQIAYRKTHELMELLDLIHDAGIGLPEELEDSYRLTPFAVEFRYDAILLPLPLDRAWAMDIVRRTRQWAEGLIQQS